MREARIRDLADRCGLSYSRVLQILKDLNRLGLVELMRGRVRISPFLADLLLQAERKFGLANLLKGSTPIILSKLFEPKTPRNVASLTRLTEKYVRRILDRLSQKGIVLKENSEYRLADDALIRVLVLQFSRVIEGVEPEARVIYRDNYCIIKEAPKGIRALGTPTAFSVFHRYGIVIDSPREYYYYPPKRISVEEVIVHSLLIARTKYENTLVALLYAKLYYSLDSERLYFYARWFNQLEKLFRLDSYLSGTEDPLFCTWDELRELAEKYNVDLTPFEKRHFREEILEEIGTHLDEETEALLFGGAAMVLKGYKISTKDIDMSTWRQKDLENLDRILTKLGYSLKSKNSMRVYEKRKISRIDLYHGKAGKLKVSNAMVIRAQKIKYGKLILYIASDTDLLLLKITSGRPRDYEDAKKIIRKGKIDWRILIDELLWQEEQLKKHYCLVAYINLSEIAKMEKMHIPYLRKLARIVTEHMVSIAYKHWGLRDPKDIRRIIDVSEETIRRIIKRIRNQEDSV